MYLNIKIIRYSNKTEIQRAVNDISRGRLHVFCCEIGSYYYDNKKYADNKLG